MSLLEIEIADGIAVITLNDPSRRNILSGALVDEILAAIPRLENDTDVKAVIVTGSMPAFCAGADLKDLYAAQSGDGTGIKKVYEGFLSLARCPLPTIAAVNGPAVGAGFNLALACDVRIAGRSASFDTRFLKLGLHPGGGHTWMLQRAIGWQNAAATLLFGEILDGEAAVERGLAWCCVDDEELLPIARKLAGRTAGHSRELLIKTKQSLIENSGVSDHQAAVDSEYEVQMWSLLQPSFAEALASMQRQVSGKK